MNDPLQPSAVPNFPIHTRPILVVGATGSIGSQVVRALLERGAPVRVFVRSLHKVEHLPPHVERAVGTLEDRDAIARALRGVHAAFYVSPHDAAEEQLAGHFVSECERAGVRLVFSGVYADGKTRFARWLQRTVFGLILPHYRPKLRLAERIRRSHTRAVMLIPGNYFQMDEVCRDELLAGRYPLPLGVVPRVDTRDVGDAAARALLDPAVPCGDYTLCEAAAPGGEGTAAHWAAALGRPVSYAPDIPETDAILARAYSGRKALDCQLTYRLVGRLKLPPSPAAIRQTEFLLGRAARSHADYARETAAVWRAGPSEPAPSTAEPVATAS